MEIKLINKIDSIEVTTSPSWKDTFKVPLEQIVALPGVFFEGSDWGGGHQCKKCNNQVITSKSNLERMGRLSINRIKNKRVLKWLGELFELNLKDEIDENGFHIFNYSLTGLYKSIASVAYYTCDYCSSQYLLTYFDIHGDDDRHPEPDKVYIEKILQVEFDHEEFMEELKIKN